MNISDPFVSENTTDKHMSSYGQITWKVNKNIKGYDNTTISPKLFDQIEEENYSEQYLLILNRRIKKLLREVELNIDAEKLRMIFNVTPDTSIELSTIVETTNETSEASFDEVFQEFKILFAQGKNELFEDGEESLFSKELISMIKKYREISFDALASLMNNQAISHEVISEALRWIGRMESSIYYQQRKWLLEYSLKNSSARVRDGAVIGLAAINDPHSIQYVEKALNQEQNFLLKQNIQQLLNQLLQSKYRVLSDTAIHSESFQTMLASEDILKREWDSDEEDEAWSHL
ncbi:MAG: hypothetical protein Phog2KO_48610 [Phototrophicaceae bacterium]